VALRARSPATPWRKAGIIVNKNAIPFDSRPPADPSGIRVGSAAETTRGRKEKDFKKIAAKIDEVLKKAQRKSPMKKALIERLNKVAAELGI